MAYIDRDIFINNELIPLVKRLDLCHPKQKKGVLMAIQKLNEEPTADVVKVKYGQWKKHRDDGDCEYIECSVCREEFYPPNNEFEFDYYPKYCQECGAKMDLEEE